MAITNMTRDCALLSQGRCLNCSERFPVRNKRSQRFSLSTKLDENTSVQDVVGEYFIDLGFTISAPKFTYVCYECLSLVYKWSRGVLHEKKFKYRTRQHKETEDCRSSYRPGMQAPENSDYNMEFIAEEAGEVWATIFKSLYGASTYKQWSLMKMAMGFNSEHDYVEWLMKCALPENETQTNGGTPSTNETPESANGCRPSTSETPESANGCRPSTSKTPESANGCRPCTSETPESVNGCRPCTSETPESAESRVSDDECNLSMFSAKEADQVWVSLFKSLYGISTYKQWSVMKVAMGFESEHEYVEWLMKRARKWCSLPENETETNVATSSQTPEDSPMESAASRFANGAREVSPTISSAPCDQQQSMKDPVLPRIRLKCDDCGYGTTKPKQLAIHRRMHTGEKPYVCDLCDFRGAYCRDLTRHRLTHGERPYECDTCDYRSAYAKDLARHKFIHTGEKPHECDVCGHRTADIHNLAKHRRKHTDEETHLCDICGYVADSNLATHKRIHHKPPREKSYLKCDICGYCANVPNNLAKHKLTHTGEKPFECDQCDFRCAQKVGLNRHKLNVHAGEMRYMCDICGYRAIYDSSLLKHKRTHAGAQHACDTCDFRTAHPEALASHRRTHTGEKPYACGECDYRATDSGSLAKHKRKRHREQLPYGCDVCDYRTAFAGFMATHRRKHIGEKPSAWRTRYTRTRRRGKRIYPK